MTEENQFEQLLVQKRVNDCPIEIDFIGSAGAGKSSYLSAIHRVLGYGSRGIKLDRGFVRSRAGSAIANSMRGVNRSNATHKSFDSLKLYGYLPEGVLLFNFLAPGGHRKSAIPENETTTTVYFLDLELVKRAKQVIQQGENFEFFPFKENNGAYHGIEYKLELESESERENSPLLKRIWDANQEMQRLKLRCDPDKPLLNGIRYATCRAFPLELFKEDELGVVIESALDAELKLDERVRKETQILGIKKYDSRKTLPSLSIVENQTAMNLLLSKYFDYINQNGFPYKPETQTFTSSMSQVHNAHNSAVKEFRFGNIKNWFQLDTEPAAKMNQEIIKSTYTIAKTALTSSGIDASNFRLIRFIDKKNEDGLTIHYDRLKL